MEFAESRLRLLLDLRSAGVTDQRVLAAMESLPRDAFLQGVFRERAYEDRALPIACGQTISQPTVVARMTQALELRPRDKVLEIGTGSGYQAAILSRLVRRVYTVERHRNLARDAESLFRKLDLPNITVVPADGSQGLPAQAPFDRILLTAAAEDPPAALLAQLKPGGIMILPVGQSNTVQNLIKVVKSADGFEYSELGEVRFVPLLAGMAKDPVD